MSDIRQWTRKEIEARSAELLQRIMFENPDESIIDLCHVLMYGASFVLYTTLPEDRNTMRRMLAEIGSFSFTSLTTPLDASIPQPEKDGEAPPTNREDQQDPRIQ